MKSIARLRGRRRVAVVVVVALVAAGIAAAAQTVALGGSPRNDRASVAVALPKVARTVFRGDVRYLPQVATRVTLKRELDEPRGWKPLSGRASPPAPNRILGRMPSPIQNFAGLSRTDSCTGGQCGAGIPPDTNGAVGPNNYIEGVNSAYGIYSKTGSLLASFTENSLWSGNGSFCDGHGGGDPVVIYDPTADRWILTHLAYGPGASTGPFYQCVAVSRSGNPVSGGWYLYALQMDQGLVPPNTLNDYPNFGIWTDCLDFSFNGFLMPAGAYNGTGYGSLSRSDMYAGASLTWALGFLPGQASDAFTMIPSNLEAPGSAGLPPAGTPDYFVSESIFNFAWNVRKFTAGANCGGGGTLGAATPVGQSSYSGGGGSIVPQPPPATAANTLDSLFDRMMQKVQYRRVGSAESLWVVHTVGNSGANTGPQWGQIDVTGRTVATTPVQQQ